MTLSTLTNVKLTLTIPVSNTSQDSNLTKVLNAADAAIKAYCKRALESASYTWFLNGTGLPELPLPEYPVISVTSCYLDSNGFGGQRAGGFPASSLLTQGIDYILRLDDRGGTISKSGMLIRIVSSNQNLSVFPWTNDFPRGTLTASVAPYWPKGEGNLKVTATAGYNPVPADLGQACDMLAAWLWRNQKWGGVPIQSQAYEEYSYSMALSALYKPNGDPEIGTIGGLLAPYKKAVL